MFFIVLILLYVALMVFKTLVGEINLLKSAFLNNLNPFLVFYQQTIAKPQDRKKALIDFQKISFCKLLFSIHSSLEIAINLK